MRTASATCATHRLIRTRPGPEPELDPTIIQALLDLLSGKDVSPDNADINELVALLQLLEAQTGESVSLADLEALLDEASRSVADVSDGATGGSGNEAGQSAPTTPAIAVCPTLSAAFPGPVALRPAALAPAVGWPLRRAMRRRSL